MKHPPPPPPSPASKAEKALDVDEPPPVAALATTTAVSPIATTTKPPTILFYDPFTDADGTPLASHTPDVDAVGSGWILPAANLQIQNNQAYAFAGATNHVAWCNVNATEYTTSMLRTGDVIIYARMVSTWLSNYYQIRVAQDRLRIIENNGGVNTERASVSAPVVPSATLTATVTTTRITAEYDGATCFYDTTLFNTATRTGFNLVFLGTYTDDFLVVG